MYKNKKGFTLIEMLIVLMIISVLIIMIVPTLSKSSNNIDEKGCEALISVVQAQVNLFQLENGKLPNSLQELEKAKYITNNQLECSAKKIKLTYDNGIVSASTGKK